MQDVQEQDTLAADVTGQDLHADVSDHDHEDDEYGPPRGTVAFVALMLGLYIVYYAWHYVEIFILRGL